MRLFLVMLASALAVACANGGDAPPADAADANAPVETVEGDGAGEVVGEAESGALSIEEMRAQSLAEIDQAACQSAGGEVRQEGMLGMYRCVTPYADAGKACRSGAECAGKCLAPPETETGGDPDAEVVGVCQTDDSPFGCYAEVENGKIAHAICVD